MQIQSLTLSELLKSVVRRPWWLVVPVVLCLAAGYGVFRSMTPIYRASTLVMVEKQKVPADYVKATVTSDIDERLKTIEQQITNRDNLERIIVEMNLYPEVRSGAPADKVVEQMRRRDLAVERRGDVFRIYFKDRDPVRSAAVANRIAELFIAQNLKIREDQAQGTSSFLGTELAETKQKLEQQEARIAAFKRVYMGALPEQRDANLQAVSQLQTKLEINMDAVDKAETRKIFLQAQIAELQKPAAAPLPGAPLGSRRSVAPRPAPGPARRADQPLHGPPSGRDPHPGGDRPARAHGEHDAIEESEAIAPCRAPAPRVAPVSPALRGELEAVNLEIRSLRAERERILSDISATRRGSRRSRASSSSSCRSPATTTTSSAPTNRCSPSGSMRGSPRTWRRAARASSSRSSRRRSRRPIRTRPISCCFLAGGLAGGGLLGLGAALLREQTDSTYGDAEELQQAFPRSAGAGHDPDLLRPGDRRLPERRRRGQPLQESMIMDLPLTRPPRLEREGPRRRSIRPKQDAPLILHVDPPSFVAEQFRSLAVHVEERINPIGTWGYVLTVTSPEEGAGKTLTSLNLALTLTRGEERRVLLVEGTSGGPSSTPISKGSTAGTAPRGCSRCSTGKCRSPKPSSRSRTRASTSCSPVPRTRRATRCPAAACPRCCRGPRRLRDRGHRFAAHGPPGERPLARGALGRRRPGRPGPPDAEAERGEGLVGSRPREDGRDRLNGKSAFEQGISRLLLSGRGRAHDPSVQSSLVGTGPPVAGGGGALLYCAIPVGTFLRLDLGPGVPPPIFVVWIETVAFLTVVLLSLYFNGLYDFAERLSSRRLCHPAARAFSLAGSALCASISSSPRHRSGAASSSSPSCSRSPGSSAGACCCARSSNRAASPSAC